jgi:hypothetical protein
MRQQQEAQTDMGKKFGAIALMVTVVGFASAPQSQAGTDMVIDNSAQAPPPAYNYAPPPPPAVYYAPPPVRVVVYPRVGYYGARFHSYGYDRRYVRRGFHRPHHWR